MTEPRPDQGEWSDPARTYDVVAGRYADTFVAELAHKPFDRALLLRFAASVPPHPVAAVCDLGCGPGHIGGFLAEAGLPVVGVDLSAGMVAEARRRFPALRFSQGDMTALPQKDGTFGAMVCFYALIHIPRWRVPEALAEMRRTLAPGAPLLLAVHGGTGSLHADEMLERPVSLDATLFALDELTAAVEAAGFDVVEAHERAPYEEELATPRLYVWAH